MYIIERDSYFSKCTFCNVQHSFSINFFFPVPTLRYGYSGSTKVAMLNTTVNISCTFYGEPSPKITWEKYNDTMPSTIITESTILSSNSSFTVVQSTLKWMNVRKSDHGTYICNAENVAGKDRQVIVLDVNCKKILLHSHFIILDNIILLYHVTILYTHITLYPYSIYLYSE